MTTTSKGPEAASAEATGLSRPPEVAYYSMEIAIADAIPSFSGGLGVLAGDHLRAAADRGLPLVAVTLLYRHGFFHQSVDASGKQSADPVDWLPDDLLEALPQRIELTVSGRTVVVRPWRLVITGVGGHTVPVYMLDTNLPENVQEDRDITDRLYVGTPAKRLAQEAVLGIGGPLMIEALGLHSIRTHHMNEGHGSLVGLTQLAQETTGSVTSVGGGLAAALHGARSSEVDTVRHRCVFTTHTPVPAGHDRFPPEVVDEVLGNEVGAELARLNLVEVDGTLNMTLLGMSLSHFVNAVSQRHRTVSQAMFPSISVKAVTNGIHTSTWASPSMAALFDRHLPGWRVSSTELHYVGMIPTADIRTAHRRSKVALLEEIRERVGVNLDVDVFTIGIARRFAAYKRNDLLLSDPERLKKIAKSAGPLQIVYSGKAHPQDQDGQALIANVVRAADRAGVPVVFLPDYGMTLAGLLVAGTDIWLNTPEPPNEASGTSGMKAALNGVPSVSTLDGWWLEGHIEGVTGWGIGRDSVKASDVKRHADDLYEVLESAVMPLFYQDTDAFDGVRRCSIMLNASFFSADRMVDEYARRAYKVL